MNTRNTVQKMLIKDAVRNLKTHPSAEEIYKEVTKVTPSISKGTVYRNLGILAENGEILRIQIPNSSDRFDFYTEKHYHLKCCRCGRVCDVDVPYMEELNQIRDRDCDITGYDLVFKGTCKHCRECKEDN